MSKTIEELKSDIAALEAQNKHLILKADTHKNAYRTALESCDKLREENAELRGVIEKAHATLIARKEIAAAED